MDWAKLFFSADGRIGFNALGVVSFDPGSGAYSLTSWALGRNATVPHTACPNSRRARVRARSAGMPSIREKSSWPLGRALSCAPWI